MATKGNLNVKRQETSEHQCHEEATSVEYLRLCNVVKLKELTVHHGRQDVELVEPPI